MKTEILKAMVLSETGYDLDELIASKEMIGDYSELENSFMGCTMVKRQLKPENIHSLMDMSKEFNLVGHKAFKEAISFITNEEDHTTIKVSGDAVSIVPDGRGIMQFRIKSERLSGAFKVILIQEIIKRSRIYDVYEAGEWEMYVFAYNGYTYIAGFITNGDGFINTFMKDYKPRSGEPTVKDYYTKWQRDNNKVHQPVAQFKAYKQGDSQYSLDDNITAFGSERLEQEIQECMEYILAHEGIAEAHHIVDIYAQNIIDDAIADAVTKARAEWESEHNDLF